MLDYIWLGMIIIGIAVGILNGRVELVTQAALESAKTAIELCIGLLGIMCLWTGLMGIAEKSGMVRRIARLVKPIMTFLFPGIPRNNPAVGSIVMNLVANFLGLGNAATPLGIKAMGELQKINPNRDTASNSMIMFLVLNTAAIQLIPATIIALRAASGSNNPGEIIVPIWIASICASAVGIIAVKLISSVKSRQ